MTKKIISGLLIMTVFSVSAQVTVSRDYVFHAETGQFVRVVDGGHLQIPSVYASEKTERPVEKVIYVERENPTEKAEANYVNALTAIGIAGFAADLLHNIKHHHSYRPYKYRSPYFRHFHHRRPYIYHRPRRHYYSTFRY